MSKRSGTQAGMKVQGEQVSESLNPGVLTGVEVLCDTTINRKDGLVVVGLNGTHFFRGAQVRIWPILF